MSLTRTLNRKTLTLLGLNSGTSADGLDMAAIKVSQTKRGPAVKFLTSSGKPYPVELQELILNVADSNEIDLKTVIHLDSLLGQFFGHAAATYIRKLAKLNIQVDVVASHGQTVRHLPDKERYGRFSVSGTLQLGSLDSIAAITGRTVVGDFRQADIAGGGEGAPITAGAMQRLFSAPDEPRLIVNIGGMANYFYFPVNSSKLKASAADCGPGNSLGDILSQRLFGEKFDRNGTRASKGKVSQRLLTLLLASSFFSSRTVSTGRETFGAKMVQKMIDFGGQYGIAGEDLLATAMELTATAITGKVQPLVCRDKSLSKLYLTGGGRKNIFLVNRLRSRLREMEVQQGDVLGIDADFVEAAAYAVMGEACLRSEPLGVLRKNRSGLDSSILGRIVQPPVRSRI